MADHEFYDILSEEERFPETEAERILKSFAQGIQLFLGDVAVSYVSRGYLHDDRLELNVWIDAGNSSIDHVLRGLVSAQGAISIVTTLGIRMSGDFDTPKDLGSMLKDYLRRPDVKSSLSTIKSNSIMNS